MKERIFRFKQFEVAHQKSAMKVGVDGVLVGAWANLSGAGRILDAGTGCGLISLMCAQRNPTAQIIGVDIDELSIEEACLNASNSCWNDRLSFVRANFMELEKEDIGLFDVIVSNPPFFCAGVTNIENARLASRHVSEFGPESILTHGINLLTDKGKIAFIAPSSMSDELVNVGKKCGLYVQRMTYVKGLPHRPIKRVLLEFSREHTTLFSSVIILESTHGNATDEYKELCKDFYLKF